MLVGKTYFAPSKTALVIHVFVTNAFIIVDKEHFSKKPVMPSDTNGKYC